MFLIINFIIFSAFCTNILKAENFYEKTFYKATGPYYVSKQAVNWTEAKIGCKNADLELASATSEEEQAALKLFVTQNNLIPEDKWSGYWLSGIRQEDGKYYWASTKTEIDSSFRGWAWGEPSHAYGKEDCVELKWDEVGLGWNDYFCDETRRYICEATRKEKPKPFKKKLYQKPFNQKKWQYNDIVNSENDTPGPEAAIDYYWTTSENPQIATDYIITAFEKYQPPYATKKSDKVQ